MSMTTLDEQAKRAEALLTAWGLYAPVMSNLHQPLVLTACVEVEASFEFKELRDADTPEKLAALVSKRVTDALDDAAEKIEATLRPTP